MIKTVIIDGEEIPAIIVKGVTNHCDISALHDALFEILENCFLSDQIKDNTSSLSLWYFTQLLESLCYSEKKEK